MSRLTNFRPVWVRRERLLDFLYIFSDFAALLGAFCLTFDPRFGSLWIRDLLDLIPGIPLYNDGRILFDGHLYAWQPMLQLVVLGLLSYAVHAYFDLYHGYRLPKRPHQSGKIVAINLAFLGLTLLGRFLSDDGTIARSFILIFYVLKAVLTILFRHILRRVLRFVRRHTRRLDSAMLVIGDTPHSRELSAFINRYHPHGMFVAAHADSDIANRLDELRDLIQRKRIRSVVIGDKSMPLDEVMDIIELTAELKNISCIVITNRLNVLPMKAGVPCSLIKGVPCIYFDALHSVFKDTWPRRLFSRGLAALALLCLSPLFLVVAILVKATSKGPVFFLQDRYGINRKSFKMFKFRTMCADAEAKLAALEKQNKMGRGGLFKMEKDPRITSIGHILRRYSIDELPQFINVFLGDMRIVGPRPLPERDYKNYYRDWHYGRHLGFPGLTCLWQVSGRSDIDFETMCVLDLYYIRNNNWALDLSIIFRTIAVIFSGKGAY